MVATGTFACASSGNASSACRGVPSTTTASPPICNVDGILASGPRCPVDSTLARVLNRMSWGAQEREEPLRRAYELCERVADPGKILPALFQVTQFNITRMRLSEARELASRALALAPSSGDPVLKAGAPYNAGESSFWYGDLRNSHAHLERAFALIEKISPNALIRAYGVDCWFLGAMLRAVTELLFRRLTRAIDLETRIFERATSSPWLTTKSLGLCSVHVQHKSEASGIKSSNVSNRLARFVTNSAFLRARAWQNSLVGWASFWRGERARGLQEMSEAVVQLRELGTLIMSTWRLVLLAEAQIELESYGAAGDTVADASANLERTNEGWCEAEVYRVAGELKRRKASGDIAVAEQQYRKAIDVARNQGAKWWELRAVKSLARVLRDTNRRDEGTRDPRRNLRLVHGRLRHRRPQ